MNPTEPAAAPEQRREVGRAARAAAPRSSHAEWAPGSDRPDPVAILERQAQTRIPELVPLRHRRMLESAFTFYRGGAAIMAADLAPTPSSGVRVQLCGDAHLSNFGGFAAPDRSLVFDCNDFDETLPGPWEWDVKRLAASFEIGGRDRGFTRADREEIVATAVASYRRKMAELSGLGNLELRYRRYDLDQAVEDHSGSLDKQARKIVERNVAKARSKTRMRALAKLTEQVDGKLRIASQPPVLVPIEELGGSDEQAVAHDLVNDVLADYSESLAGENRHLLSTYRYVHSARKVVGVGSVGTRAWVALLVGRDQNDPLFLQIKEAEASVLEPFAGAGEYPHHGRRVVEGQRLMQAAGDILLGWTSARVRSGAESHFYVRQLWDAKASARVDLMAPAHMGVFAEICGATLARAHARSGDRIAIAGYLGKGAKFDQALTSFARAYADQNESDFAAFQQAISDGRLEVAEPEA